MILFFLIIFSDLSHVETWISCNERVSNVISLRRWLTWSCCFSISVSSNAWQQEVVSEIATGSRKRWGQIRNELRISINLNLSRQAGIWSTRNDRNIFYVINIMWDTLIVRVTFFEHWLPLNRRIEELISILFNGMNSFLRVLFFLTNIQSYEISPQIFLLLTRIWFNCLWFLRRISLKIRCLIWNYDETSQMWRCVN